MKARYSGGVWSGEGTEYDGTTEPRTPGRRALRVGGGVILGDVQGPRVGNGGDGSSGHREIITHSVYAGTDNQTLNQEGEGVFLNDRFRVNPTFSSQRSAPK